MEAPPGLTSSAEPPPRVEKLAPDQVLLATFNWLRDEADTVR